MLIGNWSINVIVSIAAFLFVFIGSSATNSYLTSFIRGSLAFLFFFIITYFFRWLLYLASTEPEEKETDKIEQPSEGKDTTNKQNYSEEDIIKASEYVKDLIND